MMMTFSCTLAAGLRSVALVRFVVRDLLAVVTLFWAFTTFKHSCGARLPSGTKNPSPMNRLASERFEVYDHRAVCLGDVSLAELCYLCNFGVIFSAETMMRRLVLGLGAYVSTRLASTSSKGLTATE
jgi:hypothetical protein